MTANCSLGICQPTKGALCPPNQTPSRHPSSQTPRPPAPHSEALAFFLKGARLVLARNPFYILSAALLVWSMYRLSLDGRISHRFGQLFFNFSSLEVYELLLAATAIALARRNWSFTIPACWWAWTTCWSACRSC